MPACLAWGHRRIGAGFPPAQPWTIRLFVLLVTALLCRDCPASDEAGLKAAFLRNFIEYVRWPDEGGALAVCSLAGGEGGQVVALLKDQRPRGKDLAVRRVADLTELSHCQAVYLAASERAYLAGVLEAAGGKPLLVVADMEGAAQLGATLSLHLAGGRIGFDANVSVARDAGLRLGSRLLQLARRVY